MVGLVVTAAVIVLGLVVLMIFRSKSLANDGKRQDAAAKRRG